MNSKKRRIICELAASYLSQLKVLKNKSLFDNWEFQINFYTYTMFLVLKIEYEINFCFQYSLYKIISESSVSLRLIKRIHNVNVKILMKDYFKMPELPDPIVSNIFLLLSFNFGCKKSNPIIEVFLKCIYEFIVFL